MNEMGFWILLKEFNTEELNVPGSGRLLLGWFKKICQDTRILPLLHLSNKLEIICFQFFKGFTINQNL